jgi:hypothetical protein
MKRTLFATTVLLCAAYSLPALAERWVQPTNVIMTYTMLPSGDIKMKVIMPTKEWESMGRDMKVANGSCRVTDVIPGQDTAAMILVCSGPTP